MSGICGLISTRPAPPWHSRDIENIARVAAPQARATTVHAPEATFAAVASSIPAEVHQVDGILAAVHGHAQWPDGELASVARTRGAAAALAESYIRYRADCVLHVRGPCAIAVADTRRRSGLLAIDRLGIRGLCYAMRGDVLVFGTRADHVAAHAAVGRALSDQAIFNYLHGHVVASPCSIYANVGKLRPGERIVLDDGKLRHEYYWRLVYVDRSEQPIAELEDRFRGLARAGVQRAVRDEAVGAFLSGGTDSSTVTGMLTQALGRSVDTYSIGFNADGFDEIEYARIAARHFHATVHERYVTPGDVVDAIPRIAAACDEPFGNASIVPAYYCARMAQEDGKRLLLAGDGGDELFGGNARYAKQKVFEAYWMLPRPLRQRVVEPLVIGMPGAASIPALRKLQRYVQQARVPLPDRLETYNFLEREPLSGLLAPEFLARVDPHLPAALARDAFRRAESRSVLNRMMHLDLKQTLADNDLRKVNIACELAGIGVAYPLLDEDLVEFSGLVPPGQKVKGLRLRFLFKQALRDFLPPETIAKTKHGFGLPFGIWLQSDRRLREMAGDSLASLRGRAILRDAYLDRLASMHGEEHASYYGVMVWVLMMLEQWLRAHGQ